MSVRSLDVEHWGPEFECKKICNVRASPFSNYLPFRSQSPPPKYFTQHPSNRQYQFCRIWNFHCGDQFCPLQSVVAYPSRIWEEFVHFSVATFDNTLLCNHLQSLNTSALLVRQLTQYIQAGLSLLNPLSLCNSSVSTSRAAFWSFRVCPAVSAGAGTAYRTSSPVYLSVNKLA
jgi:hypothetical protein